MLLDHNTAAYEFTEGRIAGLVGAKASEMLSERPGLVEVMNRCFEDRATIREEMRHGYLSIEEGEPDEGRCLVVSFVFVPPDLVMVHTEDVTERKDAEEALKRSKYRLRVLFEHSLDLISLINPDNTFRYISPSVRRLLGYEPEELKGTLVSDLVHPEDFDRFGREIVEQIQSGISPSGPIEGRYRHKDGSWRHLESTCNVLIDDLNVEGVVCASRDVTERKEAEEALKKSEERFRSLVQNASDVITVYDAEGIVRYVSPAIERMLGYEPEERVGSNSFELIHPDDVDRARGSFVDALRRPNLPISIEVPVRHKDGSWRHVEAVGTNVLSDPSVRGIVLNSRDVTERMRAEKALKESEERYRTLSRELALLHRVRSTLAREPNLAGVFRALVEAVAEAYGYTQVSAYLLEGGQETVLQHQVGYDRQIERIPVEQGVTGRVARTGKPVLLEDVGTDPDFLDAVEGIVSEICVPLFDGGEIVGLLNVESTGGVKLTQEDLRLMVAVGEHASVSISRARLHARVRQSEESFRSLTQNASDIITLLAADGTIKYESPSIERILGYRPEELLGENAFDYIHPEDLGRVQGKFAEGLTDPDLRPSAEYRFRHKDGSWCYLESVGSNLLGDPEVGEFVVNSRDVTERKRAEERLHHQAFHDLLTGLPNRSLFVDRLKQALRRTKRRRGRMAAVLFMDLDGFKVVNDSLGHEVGDGLLVAVAERLRNCVRPEDTLARFGGDEFAVLVEEVEGPEDAVRVAERIGEGLRESFVVHGSELFVGASVGIALGGDRTTSPEDLLRDADTAMYRAKEEGSGCRVFDPGMYERVLRRLGLENDIRRAVRAEEFVVHYQPIVHLRSGEVRRVEALVRWEHPEWGLLDPAEFMPLAEETGLVVPVGEGVLKEACRQGQRWREEHPRIPPVIISVNLSARQLGHPELVKTVEGVLRETGFEASRLVLDVTETVYIKVLEGNTATLNGLKRLGVGISIDDFGVGYSSLSYLKRLPADVLKIDRSFVAGIGEDVEDTAIVRMVIELAHTLGMEVVAEGVESADQARQLKEMGCDFAQGFYFSEALPPEEAAGFLAR